MMSGSGGEELAEAVDRVVLDIKALVLLCGSEERLRTIVVDRILRSGDEEVGEFVRVLREGSAPTSSTLRVMGELVLSVLFIVAGITLLAPVATGAAGLPSGYFAGTGLGGVLGPILTHIYTPILVVLGLLLLGASFATLRGAAEDLRRS